MNTASIRLPRTGPDFATADRVADGTKRSLIRRSFERMSSFIYVSTN